jgi:predicted transcriptional regulator
MKTATIPALRVEPEFRQALEDALDEDESLSSFMEAALRETLARRQLKQAFIARGLASRDEAQKTGEYFTADEVHAELQSMLDAAKQARERH